MTRILLATVVLSAALAGSALARDGAFYVPAHKTDDGTYVPPNVPPNSAAAKPVRGPAAGHRHGPKRHGHRHRRAPAFVAPMFIEAEPIRR